MTDWALNRLNIIGPDFEVNRFVQTCIRPCDGTDDVTFDFEALRAMPEVIWATADDQSLEAKERARRATGYDDIRNWSLSNWGTKWNSCAFRQLVEEPERYSCMFDTAWSYPEPIFKELALRFPLLTVRVFSITEGCGSGVVADIRGGYYTAASLPISRRLRRLVWDRDIQTGFPEVCPLPEDLEHMRNFGLESTISGIKDTEGAARAVEQAWAAAHAHFDSDQRAQIEFAEDASGYLEWLEDSYCGDERPTWDEAQEALLGFVDSETNLRYLYQQIRCTVDVSLIRAVAERMHPRSPTVAATAYGRAEVCHNITDDDFHEWVPFAIARGWSIELTDLDAMQDSAAAAAAALERDVLVHLRSSEDAYSGSRGLKAVQPLV